MSPSHPRQALPAIPSTLHGPMNQGAIDMAECKVLLWNTQHMDNQPENKLSEAYQQKLANLNTMLTRYTPDIVALFEVGNTGKPNGQLVQDMKSKSFTLKASIGQDGGLTKDTTLSAMVFVQDNRASEFHEPFEWPIDDQARRATLLLMDKNKDVFAFCHANASRNGWLQVLADLKELGGHDGFNRLVFYGGDLNTFFKTAPETVSSYRGKCEMRKIKPEGSGFTHISIRSTEREAEIRYNHELAQIDKWDLIPPYLQNKQQYISSLLWGDLEFGHLAVPSLLDYAYVHHEVKAEGLCEAAVQFQNVFENYTVNKKKSLPKTGKASVSRIFQGMYLRSDHFPVIYQVAY